jgi:hypothetical protein
VDVVGGSTAEGWAEVGAALVDGANVDAVAARVEACPSVARLVDGEPDSVVTYLPGREVAGIRIEPHRVTVQVCGVWGVEVSALALEIRTALAPIVPGRSIDVVLADLEDPPEER